MGNEPAIVTMSDKYKSGVPFKNIGARSNSPFAVYFDLESLLPRVIEKHKPSSFCNVVVEQGNPKSAFFSL